MARPLDPTPTAQLRTAHAWVAQLREDARGVVAGVDAGGLDRPSPWGRVADGASATVREQLQPVLDADGPRGTGAHVRRAVGHLNAVRTGLGDLRLPEQGVLDAASAGRAAPVLRRLDHAQDAIEDALARADGSWAYERDRAGHAQLRARVRTKDEPPAAAAAPTATASATALPKPPGSQQEHFESRARNLQVRLGLGLPRDAAVASARLTELADHLDELAEAVPVVRNPGWERVTQELARRSGALRASAAELQRGTSSDAPARATAAVGSAALAVRAAVAGMRPTWPRVEPPRAPSVSLTKGSAGNHAGALEAFAAADRWQLTADLPATFRRFGVGVEQLLAGIDVVTSTSRGRPVDPELVAVRDQLGPWLFLARELGTAPRRYGSSDRVDDRLVQPFVAAQLGLEGQQVASVLDAAQGLAQRAAALLRRADPGAGDA